MLVSIIFHNQSLKDLVIPRYIIVLALLQARDSYQMRTGTMKECVMSVDEEH